MIRPSQQVEGQGGAPREGLVPLATRAGFERARPHRPQWRVREEISGQFAGRVGDGLICTSGKGMELYSEQLLPSFAEGATEAGRDPGDLDRMIEVKVSYDTDRNRAMEDTKIWAALALPAEAKAGIDDPREMERLARDVENVAHRRWLVSNDPDEHLEQLRPYLELGFNHLVFHAPGNDQARFLDLYGEQILPRIRAQWG